MRNVVIVANPISGRGKARKILPDLQQALRNEGCTVDVRLTERQGDARRFAKESTEADVIVGVGGDGTLHEIVNGLDLDHGPALTHFPLGTANVFAKEYKLPRTPRGVAQNCAHGRIGTQDLGYMGDTRFFLVASIGFDSWLLEHFEAARSGPIHMYDYVTIGLRKCWGYNPIPLTVELDGEVVTRNATDINIAIVRSFGGPLIFNPDADPTDGLFDVMWFQQRWLGDMFRLYTCAMLKCVREAGGVEHARARRVRVSCDPQWNVELDGEWAGTVPQDFTLEPERLRILLPA